MNSRALTTNQILILVISLLMITSTIGFTLLYNDPSTQGPDPNAPIVPDQPAQNTTLTFQAESVSAIVDRILPVLRLAAYTSETNIDVLDVEIREYEYTRQLLSSSFQKDPRNNQLIYFAEIQLSDPAMVQQSFAFFRETMSSLSNAEGVLKVLVRLPPEISMVNPELNLSKKITLPQPFAELYVPLSTQVGAPKRVNVSLEMDGSQIKNVNVSLAVASVGKLTPVEVQLPVTILSMESVLVFSGDISYNGFSTDDLVADITQTVPHVSAPSVDENYPVKVDVVDLTQNFGILFRSLDFNVQDINASLSRVGNIKNFTLKATDDNHLQANVSVDLLNNEDYNAILESLKIIFNDVHLTYYDDYAFNDLPQAFLKGEVFLDQNETIESALDLRKLLVEKYTFTVQQVPIHQRALVQLLEPVPVENDLVDYTEPFTALVLAGNTVDANIPLNVTAQVQDGEIAEIRGFESSQQFVEREYNPVTREMISETTLPQ